MAKAAAPNPLSMLTTETPGAQAFSIVSNGATPDMAAPYPTLVGTATTGHLTSPATTPGIAPSIPATQMATPACSTEEMARRRRCMPATPTSWKRDTWRHRVSNADGRGLTLRTHS